MTDDPIKLTPEQKAARDALRTLDQVPADAAFRQRLKREFVSGEIAVQQVLQPEARPGIGRWLRRALLPLAAAAMAVVVFFLLVPGAEWAFHGITGEGMVSVDGVEVETAEVETLARLIRPGARIRVPEGVSLDLIAGDMLLLELDEGAEATVPQNPGRWSAAAMLSEVATGELRLKTGPGFPGHQFNVRTPEGLIEVTGTIVSVFRGPDLTCVCVFEGQARIGRDPESMDLVPAGRRKVMFLDGRPPMVTEIMPEHQHGLEAFLQRNRDAFR